MNQAKQSTGVRVWALLQTEVFRLPPRRTWPGVIDACGLPEEVGGRIREIVRRTGLWNREQVDVARELIAHARDAIDAGVAPEAVVESLGQPRVVAKLIRRAVRRKRHWLWHTRVWMMRSVVGSVGFVMLVVGAMAARAIIGDPNPRHNYIAALNAPFAGMSEDEKAWPLYKEAHWEIQQALIPVFEDMRNRAADRKNLADREIGPGFTIVGLDVLPNVGPSHPDYEEIVKTLSRIEPSLEKVRRGSALPAVGRMFSGRSEKWPGSMPKPGWLPEPIPEPEDPAEQSMLIFVQQPYMWPIRSFATWLAFDAQVAVREGDGARAVESLRAIYGMSRQMKQEPFLISYLLALAVDALAFETVDRLLSERADVFSDEDLVMLAHEASNARSGILSLPLNSEKMIFEDFLQRTYTDNGKGDGHITNEGMMMFETYENLGSGKRLEDAALVLGAVTLASRAEQLDAYEELLSLARADADAGYEIYRGRRIMADDWIEAKSKNDWRSFAPLKMFAPAFTKTVHTRNKMRVRLDTTLAAIGAELFRREAGAWPSSLDELVPRYLPSAPEDPFGGRGLRLAVSEAGPVIYSIGPDGEDDGGVAGEVLYNTVFSVFDDDPTPEGDWVLYPPSAR